MLPAARRALARRLMERAAVPEELAARAKATGHTVPAWRRTSRPYDDETAIANAAAGKPQWFFEDPAPAPAYGRHELDAMLKPGRQLEVDAGGRRWTRLNARSVPDKAVTRTLRAEGKMRDEIEAPVVSTWDLARAAKAAGYDSVRITNLADGGLLFPKKRTAVAMLNPAGIRARDAAFDPAHADRPGVMLGVTGAAAIPAAGEIDEDLRRRRRAAGAQLTGERA